METGTAIAIGAVVIGGVILINMIQTQNAQAIAATQQTAATSINQPALGDTGGIVFGALTGLANIISAANRPSRGANPSEQNPSAGSGASGNAQCTFNPALPISATNTPVCGFNLPRYS